VEVLEQFSFLHLQLEVAFLILNTVEDLLYVVHFDLVEEQDLERDDDQEDARDG
jgi:hypothetical protein